MELIRGLHNLALRHRGSVVSIGNFDGLHRGHLALIARLKELAGQHRLPSTVVIFEPMPREFFAKDTAPPRIASLRDKLRGLERAGIERVLCLRFDKRLAAFSGDEFIERVLVSGLGARAVIVGDDFRYGRGRAGDIALMQRRGAEVGFTVEGLGTIAMDGERCSSTALRQALQKPDLDAAERLLGKPYRIVGRVRHGLKLGRKLGMPTANIRLYRRPALAHGVYATLAYWKGQPQGAPSVSSLGVRPTLGTTACLLEAHVFDFDGALYGSEMEIEFWRYLRPQMKFDSLDALATQMQTDGYEARALFDEKPAPVTT